MNVSDDWRISKAYVYNARKEMLSEAKEKIRESIVNGVAASEEGASLRVPHYLIRDNVEFRLDTSDDDDFARLEGWITYGTLKKLSGTMTLEEAYDILSHNDWHVDKSGLTCDKWASVNVAIGVAVDVIKNIIKQKDCDGGI